MTRNMNYAGGEIFAPRCRELQRYADFIKLQIDQNDTPQVA